MESKLYKGKTALHNMLEGNIVGTQVPVIMIYLEEAESHTDVFLQVEGEAAEKIASIIHLQGGVCKVMNQTYTTFREALSALVTANTEEELWATEIVILKKIDLQLIIPTGE